MNIEALFLFLILLLGLVLCSFLGGKCGNEGFTGKFNGTFTTNENNNNNITIDGAENPSYIPGDNYNHYNKSMTTLQNGSTYTGKNGGSLVVSQNSDGTQTLNVKLPNGKSLSLTSKQQPPTDTLTTDTTTTSTTTESYTNYYGANGNATTFYGPNGETATIVESNNGQNAIRVSTSDGVYLYGPNNSYYNQNEISNTEYYGSTGYNTQTYSGAYGGQAGAVTGPNGNTAYYAEGPNGNAVYGTTSGTDPYYNTYNANTYYGPNGGQAGAVTGPNGNTAYYAEGPNGNVAYGTTANGIPRNMIPPGDEDLYILKSQVVPPVCPVCPATIQNSENTKCPPCPPCARCPEPAFECKKVPNYNAINSNQIPVPVLNDFSTFGM